MMTGYTLKERCMHTDMQEGMTRAAGMLIAMLQLQRLASCLHVCPPLDKQRWRTLH
jgi:hypothetical protein